MTSALGRTRRHSDGGPASIQRCRRRLRSRGGRSKSRRDGKQLRTDPVSLLKFRDFNVWAYRPSQRDIVMIVGFLAQHAQCLIANNRCRANPQANRRISLRQPLGDRSDRARSHKRLAAAGRNPGADVRHAVETRRQKVLPACEVTVLKRITLRAVRIL